MLRNKGAATMPQYWVQLDLGMYVTSSLDPPPPGTPVEFQGLPLWQLYNGGIQGGMLSLSYRDGAYYNGWPVASAWNINFSTGNWATSYATGYYEDDGQGPWVLTGQYWAVLTLEVADYFLRGTEPDPTVLVGPYQGDSWITPYYQPYATGISWVDWQWALITLPGLGVLFTSSADTVNFRSLTSEQTAAIEAHDYLYLALDGPDTVILPNLTTVLPGGVTWNSSTVFHSGSGNDSVMGGDRQDRINGDDGDDTVFGGAAADDLSGGSGDDRLYGDEAADVLDGGLGDDLLAGGAGEDWLRGGDGNDALDGGLGADGDNLEGGAGNDTILAGDGDDLLNGDAGEDALRGENGRDMLWGGLDSDTLIGGEAADILRGGDGSDQVGAASGVGLDSLLGGDAGGNQLFGDGGDDALYAWFSQSGAAPDELTGGAGRDDFFVDTTPHASDRVLDFEVGERAFTTVGGDPSRYTILSINDRTTVNYFTGSGDAGNVTLAGTFEFDGRILPGDLSVTELQHFGTVLAVERGFSLSAHIKEAAEDMAPYVDAIGGYLWEAMKDYLVGKTFEEAGKLVMKAVAAEFANNPVVADLVNQILYSYETALPDVSREQLQDAAGEIIGGFTHIVFDDLIGRLENNGDASFYNNTALDIAKLITLPLQIGVPGFATFVQFADVTHKGIAASLDLYFAEEQARINQRMADYAEGELPNTVSFGAGKTSLVTDPAQLNSSLGSEGTDLVYSETGVDVLPDNVENARLLDPPPSPQFASSGHLNAEEIAIEPGMQSLGGNALDNELTGNSLANAISGFAGNDIIQGAGGDDVINGGEGEDTVVYAGRRAEYVISRNGDSFTIAHVNATGASEGTDTVTNAERFMFADRWLTAEQLLLPPAAVTNDFNGDGRSDVLWRSDSGILSNWLGQAGGGFVANDANALVGVPSSWQVVGTGDFNGDGRDDLLWRSDTGLMSNWLGTASGGWQNNDANAFIGIPLDWTVVGVGDFNGDTRDDILWRNDDGRVSNWLGQANGGFVANDANALVNGVVGDWQIAATGDFNGDGRDDILWRSNSGHLSNWLATASGGWQNNDANAFIGVPTSWHVLGVGDFNGDNRDDILWRSDTGAMSNWLGTASGGFTANDANAFANISLDWHIAAIGDFNGDNRDDILWRSDAGAFSNWLGTASGGWQNNDANAYNNVPTVWHVQDPDSFWL